MDHVAHPLLFYGACVVGGLGVALALPRRGISPRAIGAIIAAAGGGLALLALGLRNPHALPNIYFYIFALVGLGAALRVITHPRPVYAALYFILTVVASAGLFLILAAEFMAFALIIVYAGAILITYLFVIMLATQAPSEARPDALAPYDAQSREPLLATAVGFILLALLTGLMFRGVGALEPARAVPDSNRALALLSKRVEAAVRPSLRDGEQFVRDAQNRPAIDPVARTIDARDPATGAVRAVPWPRDLAPSNVEELGRTLIGRHPGAIEIAGVILLMAMLGAVVLSRKQVDLDEQAKARQALHLSASPAEGDA